MKELKPSRLNRDDWLEFFRGWQDAAGTHMIEDNKAAKVLAKYMPLIACVFNMMPNESLLWFPPTLTSEQCTRLQLGEYYSHKQVSSGWHNFLSALTKKKKEG